MKQPSPLDVLYEDNHLLVVNKPAMLPTMGVAEDMPSLLKQAKEYIRKKHSKPGNVYLGTVSRLDAPVTGVTLFARTSKAAARLTEQFRKRKVEKLYWAIVEGEIKATECRLTNWLRKHERHRRVEVCDENAEGAQNAELTFCTLTSRTDVSHLQIQLHTGRKHQIRVQLADYGHPILGDRKYFGVRRFPHGIALHARRLVIEHPTRKEKLAIEAPLPACWGKLSAGFDPRSK